MAVPSASPWRRTAPCVADDGGGRIYRIAYGGRTTTRVRPAAQPPTPAVGTSGTREGESGGVIAIERAETRAAATLSVTSPAFQPGAAIPTPYSGYGERFSPPLRWSNAPASTKSFVLLMEDPDAKAPKPYVHWLLYNVPADTTQLPESVPTPPRLEEPKGALQGRNSRGQIGYVGPRPPAGDPPHHYHFQVFALDAVLNVPPGAHREAVLKEMAGHVVARGEVVATFQRER